LPAPTFIEAFFQSFRSHPRPPVPENPSQGDNTLQLAIEALDAGDYIHAMSFMTEAVAQEPSTPEGRGAALHYQGTFKFLMGDSAGAQADYEASIAAAPKLAASWVKLASVHMDLGNAPGAFAAYDRALALDPQDADAFYQRGQVHFILQEFKAALDDYTRAVELAPNFVFGHIQLAVAQYKLEQIGPAMATFRRTLRQFPNRSEPFNYYGELLLDQQKFDEAIKKFDEAIALEKQKTKPINALPMVNKGLAIFQWKSDLAGAETLCREALEADPECEAALATLAQLLLQHSRLEDAVEMFRRHGQIARSEPELVTTLNYQLATQAQIEFVKNYPEQRAVLSSLARSMM